MNLGRDWFKWSVFFVFFICAMFFLFTLGTQFCDEGEKLSRMGDAFNMLNALFAGLAFVAIYFQLRMQQRQIDDERADRYRADRISALATRIQVTFDKILHERNLLLQVAPGFKDVSFLHEGDGERLQDATYAKEGMVLSLQELIATRERYINWQDAHEHAAKDLKDLWEIQAALPMMKQIKTWVDHLNSYEKEMDGLLKGGFNAKEDSYRLSQK